MTYCCPICHLRFRWASELDGHAREDHVARHEAARPDHVTRYNGRRPSTRYVTPSM
jgi:hypothetical protein